MLFSTQHCSAQMPTMQLLTHVATRSVSSSCAAVPATHSPCRLCSWLSLLWFTPRTWYPWWLSCSSLPLDGLPLPATGKQRYATNGAILWTRSCYVQRHKKRFVSAVETNVCCQYALARLETSLKTKVFPVETKVFDRKELFSRRKQTFFHNLCF